MSQMDIYIYTYIYPCIYGGRLIEAVVEMTCYLVVAAMPGCPKPVLCMLIYHVIRG